MAIKGKKKPKSRSRSTGRRPVSPARPISSAASSAPWYRTMTGQLSIIVALLVVLGAVMWWVADSRSEARALKATQNVLERYSDSVATLVESLQPTVSEMLGAPANLADEDAVAALKESAKKWAEDIEPEAAKAQSLSPPEGFQPTAVVIQQSFMLYRSAVMTYKLIPGEVDERRRQKLLDRANDQRDLAGQSLTAALLAIDDARAGAEMDPAGIQPPSTFTPISTSPSEAPGTGGDDDGKGKGRGSRAGSAGENKKKSDG